MFLFNIHKFVAAIYVPISSGYVGKHYEIQSDTHNATHIQVNLAYTILELQAYNFTSTMSKYLITDNNKTFPIYVQEKSDPVGS